MSHGLILPGDPQYEVNASGFILKDDVEVAATLQCVHGGEHFISVKGSGKKRGFCLKCNGVTCGSLLHSACYDWRKKLDDFESGKLSVLR